MKRAVIEANARAPYAEKILLLEAELTDLHALQVNGFDPLAAARDYPRLEAELAAMTSSRNANMAEAARDSIRVANLEAERAELVAALRYITEPDSGYHGHGIDKASALLAKLETGQEG